MPTWIDKARELAGATGGSPRGRPERSCPACGGAVGRVCCGGVTGHLAVCAHCGHVGRWESAPRASDADSSAPAAEPGPSSTPLTASGPGDGQAAEPAVESLYAERGRNGA